MRWQKVTLVGLGLLGGSLGLVLRQRRMAGRVEGYVRREASLKECEQLHLVDRVTMDLDSAVREADLVVLCTPLAQMRDLAARMADVLQPGAIVTDVGSVKASVVSELEPVMAARGARFVGSHPMAGAEKMGPKAARPDLFQNAVCIMTPTAGSDLGAVDELERFWRGVGTRTLKLTPEIHDELVARCSHLPHLLAATLVNEVLAPAHPPEQAQLCASGFRDTTRVASGSPEMWRDIALSNQRQISSMLGQFIERLRTLQQMIDRQDAPAIEEWLRTAKTRRDQWCAHNASPE